MKKTNIYMSDNISCTTKIACEFAKSLKENCIIYLNGDMGSGKTLFTSKVANYFGIHTITSSSFSRIQAHQGTPNIIHCDLYRGIYSSSDFMEELDSHLVEPWLLFIEWPSGILYIPNSFQYIVNIVTIGSNHRKFSIEQVT